MTTVLARQTRLSGLEPLQIAAQPPRQVAVPADDAVAGPGDDEREEGHTATGALIAAWLW